MGLKIMVSIAQANTEPWLSIWKDGQAKTWMNSNDPNVIIVNFQSKKTPWFISQIDKYSEHYRYHSRYGKLVSYFTKIWTYFLKKDIPKCLYNKQTNVLNVDCWSTYILSNRRNLSLFNYFLTTECNFLFQTVTSSYLNHLNLVSILDEVNFDKHYYAGYVENNVNRKFVAGSGKVLSRATIELIVKNYKTYPHDNLEDIALGDFLNRFGIEPIHLPRVEIGSLEDLDKITDSELENNFLFRCKTHTYPRTDVLVMKALHERIVKIK